MIGIFDSGFGGLTILRAVIAEMPQYSYMYFGDNAHAPYGEKTEEEIIDLTKEGTEFLFAQGAQVVILGCNTASAAALRHLQQTWLPARYPTRRLLGIIVPTIEQVTGADWRHQNPITTPISSAVLSIGVLATPATVASGAYPREIHKRNQSLRVVQQECPGLADAIEAEDMPRAEELIRTYIGKLQSQAPDVHAVLLGCTHYELMSDRIASLLPSNTTLYHQPSIVARSFASYVRKNTSLFPEAGPVSRNQFFTTGDPEEVSRVASRYFGTPVRFEVAGK